MIEWITNTGESVNLSNYYENGSISAGIVSLPINDRKQTEVAINGVVYNETIPIVSVVAQQEIITNSGDFFISGYQMRNTTGFFDGSFGGDVWQDRLNSGESYFFFKHNTWTGLLNGFSGVVGQSLSGDYVLLNGQKLVSGYDYIEGSSGEFVYTSVDTGSTGVLFTMPKRNQFYNSGSYDLSGQWFNKGSSIGFNNGVKVNEYQILETASIVSSLQANTGYSFYSTGQDIQISF